MPAIHSIVLYVIAPATGRSRSAKSGAAFSSSIRLKKRSPRVSNVRSDPRSEQTILSRIPKSVTRFGLSRSDDRRRAAAEGSPLRRRRAEYQAGRAGPGAAPRHQIGCRSEAPPPGGKNHIFLGGLFYVRKALLVDGRLPELGNDRLHEYPYTRKLAAGAEVQG